MTQERIASQIAQYLLEINAVQLRPDSPFTWASGLKSPIYCDNRMILSYPVIRKSVIDAFLEKLKAFGAFDAIAGVATAGIPHAALIADRLNLPMVYIRARIKDHGRQNLIEGYLPPKSKVVVIEDLISTGGSSLSAVDAIRNTGAEVVGVCAIFTYGFDLSKSAFKSANCPLITLSNYETLIKVAQSNGALTPNQVESLQEWSQSPKAWSDKINQKL